MNTNYFLLALGSVCIASVSQIILKMGAGKEYGVKIQEYLNFYVITGYGMLFISMLLTIVAYKKLSYLSVPVVEALGYIMVPTLSVLIFKERIKGKRLLGILIIIVGIVLYYL